MLQAMGPQGFGRDLATGQQQQLSLVTDYGSELPGGRGQAQGASGLVTAWRHVVARWARMVLRCVLRSVPLRLSTINDSSHCVSHAAMKRLNPVQS